MKETGKFNSKTARSIGLFVVIVTIAGFFGYRFGADLAEKHNARDAAERAASCDVDCE